MSPMVLLQDAHRRRQHNATPLTGADVPVATGAVAGVPVAPGSSASIGDETEGHTRPTTVDDLLEDRDFFMDTVYSIFHRTSGAGQARVRTDFEQAVLAEWLRVAHPKLFLDLPQSVLESIARRVHVHYMRKDQILCLQGASGRCFFLVARGRVDIHVSPTDEGRRELASIAEDHGIQVQSKKKDAKDGKGEEKAGGGRATRSDGNAGHRREKEAAGDSSPAEKQSSPQKRGRRRRRMHAWPSGFRMSETIRPAKPLRRRRRSSQQHEEDHDQNDEQKRDRKDADVGSPELASPDGLDTAPVPSRTHSVAHPYAGSFWSRNGVKRRAVRATDVHWFCGASAYALDNVCQAPLFLQRRDERNPDEVVVPRAYADAEAAFAHFVASHRGLGHRGTDLRPGLIPEDILGKRVTSLGPSEEDQTASGSADKASFGELALLSEDNRRNASVVAHDDDVILISIDRHAFVSSLQERNKKEFDARVDFLRGMKLFRSWDRRRLTPIAYALQKWELPVRSYLFQRGDFVEYMFLVVSGSVRILHYRHVPVASGSKTKASSAALHRTTVVPVEVMLAGPGSVVGEEAMLDRSATHETTAQVAVAETTVFALPRGDVESMILSDPEDKDDEGPSTQHANAGGGNNSNNNNHGSGGNGNGKSEEPQSAGQRLVAMVEQSVSAAAATTQQSQRDKRSDARLRHETAQAMLEESRRKRLAARERATSHDWAGSRLPWFLPHLDDTGESEDIAAMPLVPLPSPPKPKQSVPFSPVQPRKHRRDSLRGGESTSFSHLALSPDNRSIAAARTDAPATSSTELRSSSFQEALRVASVSPRRGGGGGASPRASVRFHQPSIGAKSQSLASSPTKLSLSSPRRDAIDPLESWPVHRDWEAEFTNAMNASLRATDRSHGDPSALLRGRVAVEALPPRVPSNQPARDSGKAIQQHSPVRQPTRGPILPREPTHAGTTEAGTAEPVANGPQEPAKGAAGNTVATWHHSMDPVLKGSFSGIANPDAPTVAARDAQPANGFPPTSFSLSSSSPPPPPPSPAHVLPDLVSHPPPNPSPTHGSPVPGKSPVQRIHLVPPSPAWRDQPRPPPTRRPWVTRLAHSPMSAAYGRQRTATHSPTAHAVSPRVQRARVRAPDRGEWGFFRASGIE